MKICRDVRKIVDYTYELEIDEQFIKELNDYLVRDTRNIEFPKVDKKDIAMHIAGVWDRADEEIIVLGVYNNIIEKITLDKYLDEYLDNSIWYDAEMLIEDEDIVSVEDMDIEYAVNEVDIEDAVITAVKEA